MRISVSTHLDIHACTRTVIEHRLSGRTTNPRSDRRPPATGWLHLAAKQQREPSVAREAAGSYSADEGGPSQDVRDAARQLRQAAERLVSLATEQGRVEGGELGALQTTLHALDAAQAAAVELTSHVQQRGTSERSAGLPLEYLLALETRLTGPDRRMLASAAETLRTMPHLARAFQAGQAGWAEVRAIVCEVRSLPADARAKVDEGFAIQSNIVGRDADRLLDEVRATAASLRPDRVNKDTARTIERRFLALQPQLGGSGGTGYFGIAGINRHGGGDENALRRRASDPRRPRVMRRRPRGCREVLAGVRAGWAIEPRNRLSGADVVEVSGRPHRQQRYCELLGNPARSKNLGMHGAFMRENREVPCPPATRLVAGRLENAKAVRPG